LSDILDFQKVGLSIMAINKNLLKIKKRRNLNKN